jgi:NADPH-dependent F420 reductase
MAVAILGGTGQQGGGIAQRLARAGFSIVLGSRDPDRAATVAANWRATGVSTSDYAGALRAADIVLLTVPFESVASLLDTHQDSFRPRALVVDVTVPISFTGKTAALIQIAEGSAAEHVRARLPSHARVAATFKTLPARVLNDVEQPLDCDEFVCGDTPDARADAARLVEAIHGLRAVDVGPLTRARAIEHLALLAIGINRVHKIRNARFRVVGL